MVRAPKLPNFFVAGAPTSGTTSLHHFLGQHPQIFMSPIKEPTFFAAADMRSRADFLRNIKRDQDALREYLEGPQTAPARYWITEWDDYIKLFRNARDEIAIGESSVSYLWLPSAAPALRSRLPDARLIFVLRNPADRLFSWYLMMLDRDPRLTFRAWFLEAQRAGGDGGPSVGRRYTLPLDGGWCATHLQRFFDSFPRAQVRVYLYEAFHADARAVLRNMFAFLGVDPDWPIDVSSRHNETAVLRFPMLDRLGRRIMGNVSLTAWLPAPASRALREIYRVRRRSFAMDPDERRMVTDCYRDDILRTGDLIGRDLSAWLR